METTKSATIDRCGADLVPGIDFFVRIVALTALWTLSQNPRGANACPEFAPATRNLK
jgi:hypothetical protein